MELESNLKISSSWNCNFTWKKLAFIGTGVLLVVATVLCISVIVGVNVKSSSSKAPLTLSVYKEKMNLIKDEIKWVSYSSDNYSLTDAFAGGTGSNGKTVYVCRAKRWEYGREYDVIPGTFDPTDALCKVSHLYKVIESREFELLITKNPSQLVWEAESKGGLRKGAISGGHKYDTELYVTRFQYGYTVLGKLDLVYRSASGPADGDETFQENYDLLCVDDYAL